MNSYPIACVGDTSSHGGFIITPVNTVGQIYVDGKIPGAFGAIHWCPIAGHGTPYLDPVHGSGWITPIVTSPVMDIFIEGNPIAMIGSQAACGAIIETGSPVVNAVGP